MITFPRSSILKFYKDNPTWRDSKRTLGDLVVEQLKPEPQDENDLTFLACLADCDSVTAGRLIIQHTDWSA